MTFVIITNSSDVHADFLVDAGERERVQVVRINTDLVRPEGAVAWRDDGCATYRFDGRTVDFATVKVVYSRRPKPAALGMEPWCERFVNKEWDHIEAALCDAAPLCLNPPVSDRAKNRLVQLRAARAAGLNVPKTLISNDAGELRAFAAERACITKGINNSYVRHEGRMYSAFTSGVDADDLAGYESSAPTLLQARIEAVAHWRVVTLLDRTFAFRYHGAALREDVDSRRVQTKLDGEVRDLPPDVERAFLAMRSRLGFNFASSDFIEDAKGQLWFVDLNPAGQWAFLEETFGLPLSSHFVRLAA